MSLAPWDDAMSDGCSGAPWLSSDPAARACCVRHDARYYVGGSAADRLDADRAFRADLLAAGIVRWRAEFAYRAVRIFGGPQGRIPRVSWAFGGERFAYTGV